MTPDSPIPPREELEARLTALLLGELPPDEAEALRQTLAHDAQLSRLHDRLKLSIGLVRETVTSPEHASLAPPDGPKLSAERREKLLQIFKVVRPKELARARWRQVPWRDWAAVAAMVIGLMALTGLLLFRPEDSFREQMVTLFDFDQSGPQGVTAIPARNALAFDVNNSDWFESTASPDKQPVRNRPVDGRFRGGRPAGPPAEPPASENGRRTKLERLFTTPPVLPTISDVADSESPPARLSIERGNVAAKEVAALSDPALAKMGKSEQSADGARIALPQLAESAPRNGQQLDALQSVNRGFFDTLPPSADEYEGVRIVGSGSGGGRSGGALGGQTDLFGRAPSSQLGTITIPAATQSAGSRASTVQDDPLITGGLRGAQVKQTETWAYFGNPTRSESERLTPNFGIAPTTDAGLQVQIKNGGDGHVEFSAPTLGRALVTSPTPPAEPQVKQQSDASAFGTFKTDGVQPNDVDYAFQTQPNGLGIVNRFNIAPNNPVPQFDSAAGDHFGVIAGGLPNQAQSQTRPQDADGDGTSRFYRMRNPVPGNAGEKNALVGKEGRTSGLDLAMGEALALNASGYAVAKTDQKDRLSEEELKREVASAPAPNISIEAKFANIHPDQTSAPRFAENGVRWKDGDLPTPQPNLTTTFAASSDLPASGILSYSDASQDFSKANLSDLAQVNKPMDVKLKAAQPAREAPVALRKTVTIALPQTAAEDMVEKRLPASPLVINETVAAPVDGLAQVSDAEKRELAAGVDSSNWGSSAGFNRLTDDLALLRQRREKLALRITQEKVDSANPKTAGVEILDPAEAQAQNGPTLWERVRGTAERSARIAVEKHTPDVVGLDFTQKGASAFDPYWIQDEFEAIQSKAVLGKVADRLKLSEAWGEGAGNKLNAEDTFRRLRDLTTVQQHPKSGLMDIRVKSSKPEEAARIANTIAEVYREQRVEQRKELSLRGVQVLEKEVAEQDKKIALAQRELERQKKTLEPQQADPAPARSSAPAPIPQPEVQAAASPFSTFSLNVSDVSFKLAAASLEKGVLPEPASVRSEEFINAFDYRDPEPAGSAPIAFAWERARYPFAHDRDLVRFSVKTAASGRQPGRPLNLVLLLDNSGSMERADRLRIRQECLRVLAGQLQPQDRVSVVAFARTARLWVDGLPGNQGGELSQRVGTLAPEGGTNLEEAMNLAYQTALRHYLANGVNRVVLLTDGAANLGDVQPDSLKKKVETHRQQGVALDCFGIGWDGYNDDLLEALSRNGDGRYGFVNTPEAAATEFAGQLAGALQVAASDVKVQVEWNPRRVTAYRQIGYAKHQLKKEQFRDNTVDAAEIAAAEAGNALYVLQVNPNGDGPLGTVRVRFKVPGTSDYREHEWPVPYNGASSSLEQSSAPLRLAASASAFSEWLASSPYAAEVTPDRLLGYLSGVPETCGADPRPKKLEWMIRQAKSVTGQ